MTIAQIGHNNPPDPIDTALDGYGDAIQEAESWLDGETVENDWQLAATDKLLKEIKAALKAVNAARDETTKPLHAAWKAEVARWKPTQDDLGLIIKGLVAAQDPYKRKLAAQKEAEKRAAWEAAEKARIEAEKAAKIADSANIEAQREAAEKAQIAQDAAKAASAKQKDKVGGMRKVYKYEIQDHRAALHWIAANDRAAVTSFIEEYVRRNHRDMTIDGVKTWVSEEAF